MERVVREAAAGPFLAKALSVPNHWQAITDYRFSRSF